MAGYMTKLQGYVYDGQHEAAAALENGVFATINASGKVAASGAVATTKFRVDEKTTLWGKYAVRLTVIAMGATDEVYLVENEWDINDGTDYDTSAYTCKVGDLCRIHHLLPGEQCIVSLAKAVYDALTVGDTATVAANGTIAKASA